MRGTQSRRMDTDRGRMCSIDGFSRDFYEVHGYLLVRGLLEPGEVNALREEVQQALSSSYDFRRRPLDFATGTAGLYLPMVGPATPLSRALLADSRFLGVAGTLLRSQVVPKPAKGILYRDASPWHCDSADERLRAVKAVAYLDPLAASTGALQVLPGSHQFEQAGRLARYRDRWPAREPVFDERDEAGRWPGVVLATNPGDVIFFDVHLWHASLLGRDRLQWSVSYAATPVGNLDRESVRSYISSFLSAGHNFDLAVYPYYDPAWSGASRPAFADVMASLELIQLESDGDGLDQ
ncbi:phytanoyl-CoA dioxygenase family protein [Nonomuraea sp. NPDC049714]|uniref:phytanoyl-CoA dioxygenase family protein n=1 Tax=Nonomuraea sp. NPDC049714 TaxID=3364357 RepID=UPI0037A690FA